MYRIVLAPLGEVYGIVHVGLGVISFQVFGPGQKHIDKLIFARRGYLLPPLPPRAAVPFSTTGKRHRTAWPSGTRSTRRSRCTSGTCLCRWTPSSWGSSTTRQARPRRCVCGGWAAAEGQRSPAAWRYLTGAGGEECHLWGRAGTNPAGRGWLAGWLGGGDPSVHIFWGAAPGLCRTLLCTPPPSHLPCQVDFLQCIPYTLGG